MKIYTHTYDDIISVENLLEAWQEFERGKKKKDDVMEFKRHLMTNVLSLHKDLKDKTYTHGSYQHFVVCDPKRRDIHKASVRDRLLHRALYRKLYPFFDTTFIADSYSCRDNKGSHRAMRRFDVFARKTSKNHTKTCWVLKCDIRKFFASIDHTILFEILRKRITDEDVLRLLGNVINSFSTDISVLPTSCHLQTTSCTIGLPLGNLTSQLLVNIYMNEFDQYVKHGLKVKYYIRYADDFVLHSSSRQDLEEVRQKVEDFLTQHLKLSLHPDKVFLTALTRGADFLGWVHFPHHKVLRIVTKRRILRKVNEKNVTSYLGLLSHGNGWKLSEEVGRILLQTTS
ncbi:MAG: group II intron reverse transcriptase domain-containing protein [Candidatus Pacebacteria bacterium]|nr:group II intron reverse transcriptase domain-containing protein [Candidatus Paceibacterota bacterium]